jgi:hypothetical protein
MTNNEPIRAQWGVAMDLMTVGGYPCRWDGETICFIDGNECPPTLDDWMHAGQPLYTRPEGIQVLPPEGNCSETPNSSIEAEVGMVVDVVDSDDGRRKAADMPIARVGEDFLSLRWEVRFGGTPHARYDIYHAKGDVWFSYNDINKSRRYTITHKGRPVVLPSLSDNAESLPDKITVGAQFRRNSDGKQCVVVRHAVYDELRPAANTVEFRVESDEEYTWNWDAEAFAEEHTYLFTPERDLSNLEDGQKIVGFDGEAVTVGITKDGDRCLRGADGRHHSVNGLPSFVTLGSMFWRTHGIRSCLTGPSSRPTSGEERFFIYGEELSPSKWADQRVADGATADDVEPEWRHLIEEAIERAEAKVEPFDYKANYERLCEELDAIIPIVDQASELVLTLTAIAGSARHHNAMSIDTNDPETIDERTSNAAIEAAAGNVEAKEAGDE